MTPFQDRTEAGQRLAEKLVRFAGRPDVLVLALPRGGVPVAFEVAQALEAPLDVFVVRKLGVPGHEELAMGAIASGGVCCAQRRRGRASRVPLRVIQAVAARELRELERQRASLSRRSPCPRGARPHRDPGGRRARHRLDDAGGRRGPAPARARSDRRGRPDRGALDLRRVRHEADECVCVITPDPFYAVGVWYEDFSQTTDDEVRDLLERANVDDRRNGPLKRGA